MRARRSTSPTARSNALFVAVLAFGPPIVVGLFRGTLDVKEFWLISLITVVGAALTYGISALGSRNR